MYADTFQAQYKSLISNTYKNKYTQELGVLQKRY